MTPDPLSVECPRCGRAPKWGCVAKSHTGLWAAATHAARWKAVGVSRPTVDDKVAAGEMQAAHRRELLGALSRESGGAVAAVRDLTEYADEIKRLRAELRNLKCAYQPDKPCWFEE